MAISLEKSSSAKKPSGGSDSEISPVNIYNDENIDESELDLSPPLKHMTADEFLTKYRHVMIEEEIKELSSG